MPNWSAISLSKPTISPVRAANLALSKFNSFPVSNSASNSAAMEDSKFYIDLEMV